MKPEQLEIIILEYLSRQPSGHHHPINECLEKWDGSKDDLVKILKRMDGKSISLSTLHRFQKNGATLKNTTVRCKLTSNWQSHYAILSRLDFSDSLPNINPTLKQTTSNNANKINIPQIAKVFVGWLAKEHKTNFDIIMVYLVTIVFIGSVLTVIGKLIAYVLTGTWSFPF